jgi:Ca2+-binding EF-hand superfamily protein
LADFPPP